jgi:hypothetical protein
MTTSANAKYVADTILAQLGGSRFCVMVGLGNRTYGTNSVGHDYTSFKIGGGAKCGGKRVNYVTVTLEPTDTYKVEFIYCSVKERTVRKTLNGVYSTSMEEVFTRNTGMATRL